MKLTGSKARVAIYELCVKNNYFTCGCNNAYEKMFSMVEQGKPINEIATVIWVCSSNEFTLKSIYENVKETLYKEDVI